MKNKKMRQRILSVLLVCALIITGAFAFLSATDSKTNVFTVGSIDIELWENFDIDNSGTLDNDEVFNESNETVSMTEAILPGEEVLKQPYVYNTGDNDAWVFMTVAIPTAPLTDLTAAADGSVNITQNNNPNKNPQIVVKAYGLQDGYGGSSNNTAALRWSALGVDVDGPSNDAVADASTRAPLFSMIDIDTTNWTQLGSVYHSADGNDYYVFAYNTMLPADDDVSTAEIVENKTSNLFRAVQLFSDIGATTISNISFVNNGYSVSTQSYTDDADIVPTPSMQPIQWVAPNGKIFASDTSRAASLYLSYELDDEGDLVVSDPNPVIKGLSTSATKPKLVPKTGTTVVIERDGVAETNTPSNGASQTATSIIEKNNDRYTVSANGFVNYFIYGFHGDEYEGDTAINLGSNIMNYVDIVGNGTVEVISRSSRNNVYGTGAKVILKDIDGNIAEQFTVVIVGDGNGDGRVTSTDTTAINNISANVTSLQSWEPSLANALLLALDINHNGSIDASNGDDIPVLSDTSDRGVIRRTQLMLNYLNDITQEEILY